MAETRRLSTLDIINEFPGVCGSVYLNTAAEGLFMRSHGAALQRYAELKQMGARGRDGCLAIEWRARELASTLLGVDPQNIAFLASTSRGLDVAIKSIGWREGDNIVLPESEFPTTAFAAVHLSRIGVERRIVPSHDGRIRLDELARWVDRRTRLVAVSLVSYKTGHKIHLPAWAEIAHGCGALLFVDGVQALGAVEVDAAPADFLCAATYKWLLGQHGLSILYVNPLLPAGVQPPYVAFRAVKELFGADRFDRYELLPDARGFEEGMPNFPGMFVLANALEFLLSIGISDIAGHNGALASRLLAALVEAGIEPLTPVDPEDRAGIVSFETPRAEEITSALSKRGIHVWGRDGRVRISPNLYNTDADIDALLAHLPALVTSGVDR